MSLEGGREGGMGVEGLVGEGGMEGQSESQINSQS